jgi:RNA polymerase sigma factor (sigma-70 family)
VIAPPDEIPNSRSDASSLKSETSSRSYNLRRLAFVVVFDMPLPVPEHVISDLQAGRNVETNAELVFRGYHHNVVSYFRNKGIPDDQCVDLAQEVFLSVFANIRSLRETAAFSGWLFGIARNKVMQFFASHERATMDSEALALEKDPGRTGLEIVLEKERRAALREALEELPQKTRACLKFRVVENLTYSQIAERQKLTVANVKVQIHRARKELIARLRAVSERAL